MSDTELECEELECEDVDFSCEVEGEDVAQEEVDMCGMCNELIQEQYLTALGSKFHPDCFACVNCKVKVAPGQDFFERNDKPLCVDCHYLLYGYKCKVCAEYIKGQRLIWGDDTFHFSCVKCKSCEKNLAETDDLKVINANDFVHVACC